MLPLVASTGPGRMCVCSYWKEIILHGQCGRQASTIQTEADCAKLVFFVVEIHSLYVSRRLEVSAHGPVDNSSDQVRVSKMPLACLLVKILLAIRSPAPSPFLNPPDSGPQLQKTHGQNSGDEIPKSLPAPKLRVSISGRWHD